jgi:hypothetical protein
VSAHDEPTLGESIAPALRDKQASRDLLGDEPQRDPFGKPDPTREKLGAAARAAHAKLAADAKPDA